MRVATPERFSALEPQLWPPILAVRAPGTRSAAHAYAMHILVCLRR